MIARPAREPENARLRRLASDELTPAEVHAIRALLHDAFANDGPDERFTDDDWQHALGGTHAVLDVGREIVAHAAVVERELHVAGRPLRTGYVEAVATAPAHQGHGHGTQVMEAIDALIRDGFELGALGTGSHGFYERLGWRAWRGPLFVRLAAGDERTADVDGDVLVLRTPSTPRSWMTWLR